MNQEPKENWEDRISEILSAFQMYATTSADPTQNPRGTDFYTARQEISSLLSQQREKDREEVINYGTELIKTGALKPDEALFLAKFLSLLASLSPKETKEDTEMGDPKLTNNNGGARPRGL